MGLRGLNRLDCDLSDGFGWHIVLLTLNHAIHPFHEKITP